MNEEKNELINNLIDIEDEIQQLWDFHPDNPDAINVKARFESCQRNAVSLQAHIQELGLTDSDLDIV